MPDNPPPRIERTIMISNHTTLLSREAQLVRCLGLALLPAFGAQAYAISAPQRSSSHHYHGTLSEDQPQHLPYLAITGSIPLRFEEPMNPLPEPPSAPVTILPPKAIPALESSSALLVSAPPIVPEAKPNPPKPEPVAPMNLNAEPPPKPLSIIPDDTKRDVQPEDILPFFQLPAVSSEQALRTAAPARSASTPPASSATYQQQ